MPDRPVYSIGAAAKIVDVPTATLRAWEDRYGVIKPKRSEGSQRLYSRNQVEQLKFIKAQIDSGVSAADAHRLLSQGLSSGRVPAPQPDASRAKWNARWPHSIPGQSSMPRPITRWISPSGSRSPLTKPMRWGFGT